MKGNARVAIALGVSLAAHAGLVAWLVPRARRPAKEEVQSFSLIEVEAPASPARVDSSSGANVPGAAAKTSAVSAPAPARTPEPGRAPASAVVGTVAPGGVVAPSALARSAAGTSAPASSSDARSAAPGGNVAAPSATVSEVAADTRGATGAGTAAPGGIVAPSALAMSAPGGSTASSSSGVRSAVPGGNVAASSASGSGVAAAADGATAGSAAPPASGPGIRSAAGATGGSSDSTARLHALLAQSAERCYPAQARRFRQTGEVTLRFCLASGEPSQVGLSGTTGSALLDEAARTCVLDGARPLPPITGCFEVPVRFGARDGSAG